MTNKYKIFIAIFLPASLALIIGLAIIDQRNRQLGQAQFEEQLQSQWLLVSAIQKSLPNNSEFKNLCQSLDLRVTLVAEGGQVLLDTGADEEAMEDHSQREEIRNAFLGVPTTAIRESRTTRVHTIYYAKLVQPGLVLRVAYPLDYFRKSEIAFRAEAFSGLIALMAAVAIFALVISRHSAKTFRELSLAVNEAKNGSLDLPTFNNIALDNALYALSAASLELKKSAQENSQLSDRLSYILGHVKEGVILVQEDEIVYRNNRADKILNFTIPNKISEINQASMIALFDKMTSDNPVKELYLGDRVIEVGYNSDGLGRLIVLHDVSDREKYLGFKTDLIANISHELKTPLTLIMATSELIIKDNQMPNEILVKFLNTIFNNSKRLNIILDDLISLHRLETVEGVETAEANLDEILFDVKELIDAKGKEISWNCDQGIVNIHSSHILSVLTNLITNAIKYSSDPKINVGVIKKDNVLEISVADGGPSIPPAERDRIFERFYSLSRSRTRERSGSGLGLSIVKHVAKIYGGQALVTENERGGNTFTVKLVQNKKSAWPD